MVLVAVNGVIEVPVVKNVEPISVFLGDYEEYGVEVSEPLRF